MKGVNKVILVGTLGNDPQFKTFPNGGSICNISLATNDYWTDRSTGEQREQTEWHRVVLHNRLAEIAQQYLRKGAKIYVEGSLRTRQWTDQNGQTRYTVEIRADEMQMLDSNRQQSNGFVPQQAAPTLVAPPQQPRGRNKKENSSPSPAPADLDDDLPF